MEIVIAGTSTVVEPRFVSWGSGKCVKPTTNFPFICAFGPCPCRTIHETRKKGVLSENSICRIIHNRFTFSITYVCISDCSSVTFLENIRCEVAIKYKVGNKFFGSVNNNS